ncbi:thioredoxin family protein [Larkinella insperata]|uniref:Thioredoxin family protein n=1 Tax=Larkinella insperata TaxID=332158 RepID=A0ABW3QBK6_9BACT|nr:thioredoxin family protein [Larkinella insperata]
MKLIHCFLIVVWLTIGAAGAQGVQFRSGTLSSVFDAARKTKKPVFVEVYSATCHVCQSFIPTFADARVGKYYNSRFVNTKIDISTKEATAFLEKNHLFVPSLPLFLYFDGQGNMMHMAMSNNTADEVIRHGMTALNPTMRSSAMRKRYEAGERSDNFLIDYAMLARVTRDTVTNMRVMNDYASRQNASTYNSPTNWLVLQRLILDVDNPMFQHLISHLDPYVKAHGAEQVKQVAENILMSSLYSSRGNQYPAAKIITIRNQLQQIGIEGRVASNRTLLPEVNAYFRSGQTAKAASRMDDHIAQSQFSTPEYLYVIRLFNRKSPDASDAPTVARWANKAIPQAKTPAEQADLYYELAEVYRRGGKMGEGLKAAQKSMDLAKTAKLDTRRNTAQLARMK